MTEFRPTSLLRGATAIVGSRRSFVRALFAAVLVSSALTLSLVAPSPAAEGRGNFWTTHFESDTGISAGSDSGPASIMSDPKIAFSTYLGGHGQELGPQVDADDHGRTYVVGQTYASEFPPGTPRPSPAEVFVARFGSTGDLDRLTFVGGTGEETPTGLDVGPDGEVIVVGTTDSSDFPTVNAQDSALSGPSDAFVLKLAPDGTPVYSTYLGGDGIDSGKALARGGDGAAYISGTTSGGFPTTAGAYSASPDFFAYVAKLSPTGVLGSSTRVPVGDHLDIDGSGAIYVGGQSDEAPFPVKDAFQSTSNGGTWDGGDVYIAKLDPTASSLEYATYIGGEGDDSLYDLKVRASGRAVLGGQTSSSDYPTKNTLDNFNQTSSNFVTEIGPTGSALEFSSFLGGSEWGMVRSVALDEGLVYLTGWTTEPNHPVTNALQPVKATGDDAFLTTVDTSEPEIVFSTYLGAELNDRGFGIAVANGEAYLVGKTSSNYFPLAHPVQNSLVDEDGASDLFVLKVTDTAGPDRTILLDHVGSGTGTVEIPAAGVSCTEDCQTSFPDGTWLSLRAIPDPRSKFAGWSGPCWSFARCNMIAWEPAKLRARFEEAVPPTEPTIEIHPNRVYQRRGVYRVSWSSTDAGVGVAHYDAGLWWTYPNPKLYREQTTDTEANFHTRFGTECHTVRAVDKVGNSSDFSQHRCTTTPYDDSDHLYPAPTWTQHKNEEGYFLGSVTRATKKDATIYTTGFRSHRVAMLVARCPRCGTFEVFARRFYDDDARWHSIGMVDTSGAERLRHVIEVKRFHRPRYRYFKLVVRSSDRPVLIDGVYSVGMTEREADR